MNLWIFKLKSDVNFEFSHPNSKKKFEFERPNYKSRKFQFSHLNSKKVSIFAPKFYESFSNFQKIKIDFEKTQKMNEIWILAPKNLREKKVQISRKNSMIKKFEFSRQKYEGIILNFRPKNYKKPPNFEFSRQNSKSKK